MNSTSRPRNIAVGSQIVFTPSSTAALGCLDRGVVDLAGPEPRSGIPPAAPALGHCAWTASSWVRRCSWISVVPSSLASIGPVTVSTVAISLRGAAYAHGSDQLDDRDHHRGDQAGDADDHACSANWRASGVSGDSMRAQSGAKEGVRCSIGSSSAQTAQRPPPRRCARRSSSPGSRAQASRSSAPIEPVSRSRLREETDEVPGDVAYAVGPKEDVNQVLEAAAGAAKQAGVEVATHAREGDPADAILDVAEQTKADLIVVGNKGMTGARRFLLGSVPNKISHHAPCSVFIVRTT